MRCQNKQQIRDNGKPHFMSEATDFNFYIMESKQIAFNIAQGLQRISDAESRLNNVTTWNNSTVLFFDEYEKLRKIDKLKTIIDRWKSYCQGQCITLLTMI